MQSVTRSLQRLIHTWEQHTERLDQESLDNLTNLVEDCKAILKGSGATLADSEAGRQLSRLCARWEGELLYIPSSLESPLCIYHLRADSSSSQNHLFLEIANEIVLILALSRAADMGSPLFLSVDVSQLVDRKAFDMALYSVSIFCFFLMIYLRPSKRKFQSPTT